MPRIRPRHILLVLLLGAGYWTYGRLSRPEYVAPAPKVSESSAKLRLAALHDSSAHLAARPELELESVEIQHLLISFSAAEGAGSAELASRTRAEAEQFAADLFSQARAGEDFDDMVLTFTDDAHPGIFLLADDLERMDPDLAADALARGEFVPAIGDLSWRLEVGEVGVVHYDPERCPLGWHLIKRLR